AYTNDAYVLSNVVTASPSVPGRLTRIHVSDNAVVTAGTPLFELDEEPYRLAQREAEGTFAQAKAALATAEDARKGAQDSLVSAKALLDDATETQGRIVDLTNKGFATEQRLDDANLALKQAQAEVNAATANVVSAQDVVVARRAEITTAQAALDLARYNLEQTRVSAPFDGHVAMFAVHEGTYLDAGTPVMAIVDRQSWRIVANIKEQNLAYIEVGQPVWLTVSTAPWTLFEGTVASIPRGISRSEIEPLALPYVEPTTSWIRLSRRFPVEIELNDPQQVPLYMGANARVFIRHVPAKTKTVGQPVDPSAGTASISQ
ncbi:MAG: HlyD family secretion protein, partial [Pseudomonadota bacterium]